jgi:hypothetical protein
LLIFAFGLSIERSKDASQLTIVNRIKGIVPDKSKQPGFFSSLLRKDSEPAELSTASTSKHYQVVYVDFMNGAQFAPVTPSYKHGAGVVQPADGQSKHLGRDVQHYEL